MIVLASPVTGWVTPLEAVPDPVFADRMLGDGIAIDPIEGRLVAPAAGVVDTVHEAGHAISLAVDGGPMLLMHIGLDTVALGDAGFSPQVKAGQRVEKGDPLILFDLDTVARSARSLVTPVIVTNGEAFRFDSLASEGPVQAGDPLASICPIGGAQIVAGRSGATVSRALRVQLRHGLHARPAARLAKSISGLDAAAELVAADGKAAPARSAVAMLGLALGHGATITIRASGPDADQAVARLVDLLDSGMGELLPLAIDVPAEDLAPETREIPSELNGIVAVAGIAIGPAWHLRTDAAPFHENGSDPAAERQALLTAREQVRCELQREAGGEGAGAEIAEAHLAMIDDPLLDENAQRLIAAGKSAAYAWRQVVEQSSAPLRAAGDRRFAERLDDFSDLERRVLRALSGDRQPERKPPAGAIVLAETVLPSQLQELAGAAVAGIATADGGATSHAAIIAAGLGLPMIVGLGSDLTFVPDGEALILDRGTLVIAPPADRLAQTRAAAQRHAARVAAAQSRAQELAVTRDGTRIEVFANLGSVGEAENAVAQGAEGCGLLRTEFLFLDRDDPPGESEQREAYQAIADALGERPLIVRTLDIGADKPMSWLPLQAEDNPALGLRGIRLQLARPELLETQLRALLGVRSNGSLRIMLPMVSTVGEVREANAMLCRLATELDVDAPQLGIMVETPAAALLADALAQEAAFFSIGSNDLTQYALARDRTNPAVAGGLDGVHPAILRLVAATAQGALAHDRVTGVCGGLAAVPEAIPLLVGLGVTELSVPAGAIADVKAIVRDLDLAECRDVARQASAAADTATVKSLVSPLLEQRA